MNELRKARPSPRVENGVLYWYEGDTFDLGLRLEVKDGAGLPVTLGQGDSLSLVIRDSRGDAVEHYEWEGQALAGTLCLPVDAERSGRLTQGRYTYDLILNHGRVVTLAKAGRIRVEGGD